MMKLTHTTIGAKTLLKFTGMLLLLLALVACGGEKATDSTGESDNGEEGAGANAKALEANFPVLIAEQAPPGALFAKTQFPTVAYSDYKDQAGTATLLEPGKTYSVEQMAMGGLSLSDGTEIPQDRQVAGWLQLTDGDKTYWVASSTVFVAPEKGEFGNMSAEALNYEQAPTFELTGDKLEQERTYLFPEGEAVPFYSVPQATAGEIPMTGKMEVDQVIVFPKKAETQNLDYPEQDGNTYSLPDREHDLNLLMKLKPGHWFFDQDLRMVHDIVAFGNYQYVLYTPHPFWEGIAGWAGLLVLDANGKKVLHHYRFPDAGTDFVVAEICFLQQSEGEPLRLGILVNNAQNIYMRQPPMAPLQTLDVLEFDPETSKLTGAKRMTQQF